MTESEYLKEYHFRHLSTINDLITKGIRGDSRVIENKFYFSVGYYALLWQVDKSWIRQYCRKGRIPFVILPKGEKHRIPQGTLKPLDERYDNSKWENLSKKRDVFQTLINDHPKEYNYLRHYSMVDSFIKAVSLGGVTPNEIQTILTTKCLAGLTYQQESMIKGYYNAQQYIEQILELQHDEEGKSNNQSVDLGLPIITQIRKKLANNPSDPCEYRFHEGNTSIEYNNWKLIKENMTALQSKNYHWMFTMPFVQRSILYITEFLRIQPYSNKNKDIAVFMLNLELTRVGYPSIDISIMNNPKLSYGMLSYTFAPATTNTITINNVAITKARKDNSIMEDFIIEEINKSLDFYIKNLRRIEKDHS